MCRSIKTLYRCQPPAASADVQAAALQYVRKISGYRQPSRANEAVFAAAVQSVAKATQQLIDSLQSATPHKNHPSAS